jgi:hypothetical protein
MSEVDELYVVARRVLLDALDALAPHRRPGRPIAPMSRATG